MNVKKMAEKDAFNWARAEMFFGDGAGIRRKLLDAEIYDKQAKIPGYSEAFRKAYDKQDWADHAIKAAKERKALDRTAAISKNARALVRGDARGLSSGVLILVGAGWVAHQTGYDKRLLDEAKKLQRRAKTRYNEYMIRRDINKEKG